jgi:hypothetical protein
MAFLASTTELTLCRFAPTFVFRLEAEMAAHDATRTALAAALAKCEMLAADLTKEQASNL